MGKFSELEIKCEPTNLVGEKIKFKKILGEQIFIEKYKIAESKYNGRCLHIQFTLKGERHVAFTGSEVLIEAIDRVPKDQFPLETIIIERNDCYVFT
jgi:hypothetical protein